LHICSLAFGMVIGAVVLAPPAAFAADSFFDEGRAQAGLEKIFDKAGHPTRVVGVDIVSNQLIVDLQAVDNPAHVDRYIDWLATDMVGRWLWPESVSGPTPVQLSSANPDLDANLFALKPADLAIVAKLAAASAKRAALEDAAVVDRMELGRQLFLLPRPVSGDPEWSVEVTSGRERATVYADLAGEITHADLDSTRRAQTINYLAGGKDLDEVVATAKGTVGEGPIVRKILVYDRRLSIEALRPGGGDRYTAYSADINGVRRGGNDDVVNVTVPGMPVPARFAFADVDWTLLPKLQRAARDRLQLPDGHIPYIEISRPARAVDPDITWEIHVESAGDSSSAGFVDFDNKGNVVNTSYPRGKGPTVDLLQAGGYQAAFDALSKALGPHGAAVELEFWPEKLLATTKDPQKPDALVVLDYRGESLARSVMQPLSWPTFGPDWFFELSQAAPIAAHWAEWQQDALTRLGLPDGKIERVTISKQRIEMPHNDRLLIEVRAEAGKRDGRVIYDLNGKVVEIIKP
jgi:hypothetical protein